MFDTLSKQFKLWFRDDDLVDRITELEEINNELGLQITELLVRKKLRCDAIDCMDFDSYACTLNKVFIGHEGVCADYDPGASKEELIKAARNAVLD
jgi:hypothetical protein